MDLFRERINKKSNSLSKSSKDVISMNTLYEGSAELLEAMLGQFYLVALIGRLVGLHIAHGDSRSRSD